MFGPYSYISMLLQGSVVPYIARHGRDNTQRKKPPPVCLVQFGQCHPPRCCGNLGSRLPYKYNNIYCNSIPWTFQRWLCSLEVEVQPARLIFCIIPSKHVNLNTFFSSRQYKPWGHLFYKAGPATTQQCFRWSYLTNNGELYDNIGTAEILQSSRWFTAMQFCDWACFQQKLNNVIGVAIFHTVQIPKTLSRG